MTTLRKGAIHFEARVQEHCAMAPTAVNVPALKCLPE
jgi:hypothetical protein